MSVIGEKVTRSAPTMTNVHRWIWFDFDTGAWNHVNILAGIGIGILMYISTGIVILVLVLYISTGIVRSIGIGIVRRAKGVNSVPELQRIDRSPPV